MKKWLLIAGLLMAMIIPFTAFSADMDPVTGLEVSKSETKFYAIIRGQKIAVGSLRGAYILMFHLNNFSFAERDQLPQLQARDFLSGEWFDAYEGAFVSGADVVPKGSLKPYFLGFSTYERAHEYIKTHFKTGIRIQNFETATIEVKDQLIAEGALPPWMSEERIQLGERLIEQELKKGEELKQK